MKTKTGPNRANKNRVKEQKQPAATAVNVILTQPKPEVQLQNEGTTLKLQQKELVVKLSGLERRWAIPLAPGWTGARRLDELAKQHAWARWEASPKITFRSLSTQGTPGTYSYLVVHDVPLERLMEPRYWDTGSRQYTTNLATVSFTHTVPLSVIKRQISAGTTSYSWFLIKYDGNGVAPGELWIDYHVSFGGVAEDRTPPVHFEVRDGKFYLPGSTTALDGFPILGANNSYTFAGEGPTKQQAAQLLDQMNATPQQVARPVEPDPTASPNARVRELSFRLPEGWAQRAVKYLGKLGKGKGFSLLKPLSLIAQTRNIRSESEQVSGLGAWSGTVILHTMDASYDDYATLPTLPPVPPYQLKDENQDGTSRILQRYASTPKTGLRAKFGNLATFLAEILLDAAGPLASLIESTLIKTLQKDTVIHRGHHAITFFRNRELTYTDQEPQPGTDEEGENPNLPDIPDFGDIEAPGETVDWSAAQRTFQGYVVDDDGTPVVHYLSTTAQSPEYFSAPAPKYYTTVRRPWDNEDKRLLGLQIKLSSSLKGHFLLLESYNWGDDGCGSFLSCTGATYLGTVARFSGITCSRSVVRVVDVDQFNSNKVMLVVGQAKDKYRQSDKGRSALFLFHLGAVTSEEVATNFLASWVTDPSVTRLKNRPKKKGSTLPTESFPTHVDFNYRSRQLAANPSIDPATPGFLENYNAFQTDKARATLPYPIEAGPFRLIMMARMDDANGWWQHVPDAAWTDTDVASYWSGTVRLDGNGRSENGASRKCWITFKVAPPPMLTQGAYVCVELIGLGGSEHNIAERIFINDKHVVTEDSVVVSTIRNGPISITRVVAQMKESDSAVEIFSAGDTSRPTTAVEGYKGDLYVTYVANMYLVKHKEVAQRWCNFNHTPVGQQLPDNSGKGYTGYWYMYSYKVNSATNDDPWLRGDMIKGFSAYTLQSGSASCTSAVSGWDGNGYRVTRSKVVNLGLEQQECSTSPPPPTGNEGDESKSELLPETGSELEENRSPLPDQQSKDGPTDSDTASTESDNAS